MSQAYVSEIDRLLFDLAQRFPKPSRNQLKEIRKYERVNRLRDQIQKDNLMSDSKPNSLILDKILN